MTKKSAPAAAVVEEQPQSGGSYVRQSDGSLELVHRTEEHSGDPAPDAPAPAEDDAAPAESAPGNGGAE